MKIGPDSLLKMRLCGQRKCHKLVYLSFGYCLDKRTLSGFLSCKMIKKNWLISYNFEAN